MRFERKKIRLPLEHYRGIGFVMFTLSIRYRRPAFACPELVRDARAALIRSVHDTDCLVPVYCFMPDHVHLLIEGPSIESDIHRAVVRFKQYAGFALGRDGRGFRWQKSFYDHVLREHEDWRRYVRYIVENPTRAGLVAEWREYPFTGSVGYDLEKVIAALGI